MAAYPSAPHLDLAAKDWRLSSTGDVEAAHPVDAAADIRLGYRKGTIAGDPDTGHTLLEVDLGASEVARGLDIERRQTASLGDLITNGSATLGTIDHALRQNGGLEVITRYRNNVTGDASKAVRNR